jgi:GAF domain-containing protein
MLRPRLTVKAMGKRSRAGGAAKRRSRKTPVPKRGAAVKPKARSPSLAAGDEAEVARLCRELSDARDQQRAMSQVLHAISRSKFELSAVLESVAEAAVRLCRADGAVIFQREGGVYRFAAGYSLLPAYLEIERRSVIAPGPGTVVGRAAISRQVIRIGDLLSDPGYELKEESKAEGNRSMIGVPLLRDGEPTVVIGLGRRRVDPFGDREIELATTFAAQAMIAIDNARLLNELRESLQQQTAAAEVLQVISSSPGDLQPVFDRLLGNAIRLCKAKFGSLYLREGAGLRLVAARDMPEAFARAHKSVAADFAPGGALGGAVRTKRPVQIADLAATDEYRRRDPKVVEAVEIGGIRTALAVPMLKDRDPIGVIAIHRPEVALFDDKQIALLTSFAAQAVIAIENARLLNELRQRTTDLTESLEQQTATSEVLQVISSASGDLEPVFAAMLKNAINICDSKFGNIYLWDGDILESAASLNTPVAFANARARLSVNLGAKNPIARMIATKAVVHIHDEAASEAYAERDPRVVAAVELGGVRTLLVVPMLREDDLIGALTLARQEVRPFNDKQIELVQNFAAQAAIAVENARLLNELRQRTTDLTESLEQQTATSEVLQVISSSPGELEPVFAAMLRSATHICEAKFGNLFLREAETFRAVAWHGEPTYVDNFHGDALIIRTDVADIPLSRVAATKQRVHVADLREEAAYKTGFPPLVALIDKGGARTLLIVPMLKERTLIGAITLYRQEVRPFTNKQIALVENFAAQAVIAIENARLLRELRERTEDVVKLNEQLEQRVTDQVGEIERMGRLRRFLPPQVADLIVASGNEEQLESHRREITALFCDLRGFTGFSESSDPEDVMALLRDYHAAIGEIIIKYSGTLERYAGDGVMVVFNDPVPVENPALQAVLMALEMRDAIGALTGKWQRLGHDIGFGIGIAHGFATLGTIGFEGRFDYAAIGTVSNVASRLCDEAKPGQILISPRVLMAVEDAIAVEPVGEFSLKGIRRPLAAYNVLAARSADESPA